MADIFLSTGYIAEEHSQQIQSIGGNFSQIANINGGRTNLDVIGKMADVSQNLETINNAYKELLLKDAMAITDIKDEYDEFDKQLSDCMGVE